MVEPTQKDDFPAMRVFWLTLPGIISVSIPASIFLAPYFPIDLLGCAMVLGALSLVVLMPLALRRLIPV